MSDRYATNETNAATSSWDSLLDWLRGSQPMSDVDEDCLAGAADLAEVERRMRAAERGSRVQMPVTFNH